MSSGPAQPPAPIPEWETDASETAWAYGGAKGPSFWGDLQREYALCEKGAKQSPIELPARPREAKSARVTKGKDAATKPAPSSSAKPSKSATPRATAHSDAPDVHVDYLPVPLLLENDGAAVRVINEANNYLTIDGKRFELLHAEFHSPSEHTFGGERFELELQLFHKAGDGSVAVVAVVFERGETAPELAEVWSRLPKERTSEPIAVKGKRFDVGRLVSLSEGYYVYDGSETRPPCREGITWIVAKHVSSIDAKEVDRYRDLFGGRTNRMVMPLGERRIRHRSR
jgi:carbonic anhydrase